MYPWVSRFTDSEGAMQGSVRQAYHIDLLRATSYERYANSRVFPTPGSRLYMGGERRGALETVINELLCEMMA